MRSYKPKRKAGRSTIAILLSLVLILSCSGITTFAAEVPEAAADQVSEEKPDASSNASDQRELSDEDEAFDRPDWLGAEVSSDARYYNSNLAEHPFSEW